MFVRRDGRAAHNDTDAGGKQMVHGTYINTSPTTIIIIFIAIFALVGISLLIATRLKWVRTQQLRAAQARLRAPKPPPSLDVLNSIAPVQRCADWLNREAVVRHTLTYDFERKQMSESTIDCAICLKNLEAPEDIRELPCLHIFHQSCFDDYYVRGSTTCPLCRTALVIGPAPEAPKAEEQCPPEITISS